MAIYIDKNYWNHDLTRSLARSLTRESRYTGHPTQYIVNDGRMTIERGALRNSNAVIYNSTNSDLRLIPSRHSSSYSYTRSTSHYSPERHHWSSSSTYHRCRGCGEYREIYYGSYCHECTSIKRVTSSPRERYLLDDYEYRYIPRVPEKRRVSWY
ncbi:hypothetical protein F4805DRAFT_460068 [Annulohypoxylon moriforme]|nr:hypothetical protein F4805DRAFT_460068 [Annulohypoxylon moriforme]